MNRALFAAASGMAAQQLNLEIIADNLANADVAGFKGTAATFAAVEADGRVGLGTAPAGRHPVFAQGKLMKSGGPFDVAIDGVGFFCVERDGRRAYTRNGAFARAADGTLRGADGWQLRGVRIPADALSVDVAADGGVTIDTVARKGVPAGRIVLATFAAPEALRSLGSTLYAPTAASGPERALSAGEPHGPSIAFGMLERSNVSIVEAMMQILTAQRAYEANAKGVQAADEMQRIANNLHRG
jgi:flagellar basal-body rod protein FlgG